MLPLAFLSTMLLVSVPTSTFAAPSRVESLEGRDEMGSLWNGASHAARFSDILHEHEIRNSAGQHSTRALPSGVAGAYYNSTVTVRRLYSQYRRCVCVWATKRLLTESN